ncbi:MAG: thioesterase family protein [Pseudomonadota bacterium]
MSADTIMDLLTLTAEQNEQWSIRVDHRLCLGPPGGKHISGGACTAILIDALEQVTGKPLIQTNAQFFATPKANENATVTVDRRKPGRSVEMISAVLTHAAELQVVLSGSFGTRRDIGDYHWTHPPDFPSPDKGMKMPFVRADPGDLHTILDMRLATDPEDGRMVFWVRTPSRLNMRPARFLALIADYIPEAIHMSIGRPAGAISLDNSIRVTGHQPTDWTLCVTELEEIKHGIFHGRMTIFSEGGELLATASQSGVVKLLDA